MNKLKISPFALERDGGAEGREVRLAVSLELVAGDSGTVEAEVVYPEEVRYYSTQEIMYNGRDMVVWRGVSGAIFTARAIRPSDAPLAGAFGFDLPVQVLAALATGQIGPENMELQAVIDDDDNMVLTLLLATDAGLFVRYDGIWHPFTEPELFDSTYMIDVHENAIEVYDAADMIGAQVPGTAIPVELNETSTEVPEPTRQAARQDPTPMAASAIEIPLTIDTEEDLQQAIVAATDSPGMRWYVEKRATALGLEVEFPW